ncbi:MAG: hypothetical protein IJV31_12650, partial [Clostridia bacterium]|nr:hypothetical protein [Clostridia bacterium]
MEEKNITKISLSTFLLIMAIIVIIIMGVVIYKLNNDKTAEIQKSTDLQAQVNSLNVSVSDLQEKINKVSETAISIEPNQTNITDKTTNTIENTNDTVSKTENKDTNTSSEKNKREYFIEKPIKWTPNTKSYDFDTDFWRPNDSAEYYIATDINNYLCIINAKKELVHKTDIVI